MNEGPIDDAERTRALADAREAERSGDWQRAEELWKRIRGRGGADEEATAVLGRLEEKRRIFQKVDSMLPGGGHRSYIGPDDLVTVSVDGIETCFHLRSPEVDLKTVIGALRRARLKFEQLLHHTPPRVRVNLHATRDELREAAQDEDGRVPATWAVATGGDRIRIALDGPEGRERHRLVVTLTHEYAHLALRELTRGRCPRWLDEGIAMALSQELPDRYRVALKQGLDDDRVFDLADLDGDFATLGDRDRVTLAYAQAASVVDYLVERDGWPGVRALLDRLATEGFDRALETDGQNRYLLGREWARWARAREAS